MDLSTTIAIAGLAVSFAGGLVARFWVESVEREGTTRRQLTWAGWVSAGISVVSLLVAIGALFIHPPGEGLPNQPLTSLDLRLEFSSRDPKFWQTMKTGQEAIMDNATESQGGVPPSPFSYVDFRSAMLPLLGHLARVGPPAKTTEEQPGPPDPESIAVLVPLDESQNAVLAFAEIGPGVTWRDAAKSEDQRWTSRLSDTPELQHRLPSVGVKLADAGGGLSRYTLSWTVDAAGLGAWVHKANPGMTPTARLPHTLKVAILYDIAVVPFREPNFAQSLSQGLWHHDSRSVDVSAASLGDVRLTVGVNGVADATVHYRLKRAYRQPVVDEYDDPLGASCTIFEFEAT